ncbi:DUF3037 domain-containing protein [Sediminibacterium soli]|uniref:DUF3037 domain-containing protein n=1 Tax=Sediminibacterium soli TaxID=2698829 RepID=UPI00137AB9C7|nr:DUF3037 domain-containing protein [Sediminibacterium soli]NCI47121.1 DUF3037 domain-containing protein [Sediminibacterium soli]
MQERKLFEYAVIRIVPRVEREEFLNVGVILYCRDQQFLEVLFSIEEKRLVLFCGALDMNDLQERLCSFEKICKGSADGGPIAKLDTASRFRWLTANRSTIIQTSQVHPGLCIDAKTTLQKLFEQLVL